MLAAALFCAACQEVEINPLHGENVLSAVIEQDNMTKTVMDDNNNILWSENDQIVAFMKSSYGHKYQVKPSFVGKSYADFSMVSSGNGSDLSAGNEWDHNVAYYPYSETVKCLKSGEYYALDVVLPAEQTYVEGSFSNGSMAMVAVSEDNNITFKNVLGGMKLQLKGIQKVTSITLEGKNSEKLSGAATVIAYTDDTKPAITMTSDASTSVTLNCGTGVQLNETEATEFIIALPPVKFEAGFTVKITDSEGSEFELDSGKQNEVRRSSLLVMPPIDIREIVVSTRMLKLVSVDYESYQVEITVPETVGPDGNIVRYNYCSEAIYNDRINIMRVDLDFMLRYNGGDRNTTDISKIITIQEIDAGENHIEPGEPTVFIAGEYTRDGQLVGDPEIIRFKTKEPSLLDAELDVQVTDISAIDATITVTPDADISQYCMLVLDDETYNYLLDNIVSEANLQWFVSSYYVMSMWGATSHVGTMQTKLSSYFVIVPPADTKYHVLVTGMGNDSGTSQCFRHVEFYTTDKQRSHGPSITVTHLPEKSADNLHVFNVKCTSTDNEDAGAVINGCYQYGNVSDWDDALNNGFTYESILSSGYTFTPDEIDMINSSEGYDLVIEFSTSETMKVAVLCYNDELTPSDVITVDVMPLPQTLASRR